ncbi:hypothetical protein F4801DRAFT_601218 [Xylaria longipes]|nr:hypothetical protein F4801DRAFT_601218 [Xylaria longipes]
MSSAASPNSPHPSLRGFMSKSDDGTFSKQDVEMVKQLFHIVKSMRDEPRGHDSCMYLYVARQFVTLILLKAMRITRSRSSTAGSFDQSNDPFYFEDGDEDEDEEDYLSEGDAQSEKNGAPITHGACTNYVPAERPHAAVEKRYRNTMQSKFRTLHSLIPPSGVYQRGNRGVNDQPIREKASKAMTLARATEFIIHLTSTYESYEARCNQHRQFAKQLRMAHDAHVQETNDVM